MTIVNRAPPIPPNAAPARVTGHAGPTQNMVMPQAMATADTNRDCRPSEPIDDAHTPDSGGQRRKPERGAVQRGDDAGEIELLAQLAEHDADAERTDEQRIAER